MNHIGWRAVALASLCAASAGAADGGWAGHWAFEGCDGRVVRDLSPRGNAGAIEGGTVRREKGTASLELDGFDGGVRIEERTPFGLTNALTAALWVRADVAKRGTVLFGKPHTNDTWTTPMFGMYSDGGRVVFGLWGSKNVNKLLVESPGDLPLRTWTHLCGTFDGAVARLYVNGAEVASRPHAGTIVDNGQPLLVGRGLGSSKPPLKGRVGELRLHDRALDAAAVRALYEATAGGYDLAGPSAPSRLDGTVTVESHGNSPADSRPWRAQPTRLLERLQGYAPSADAVGLNAYGGCLDLPKEKTTGFFRVTKADGRAWLVDPEGCRYYNVGINAVREPRGATARSGSTAAWAAGTTAMLRTNGFNGLGNWQTGSMREVPAPLPYVRRHDFMFSFAREKKYVEAAAGTQGFPGKCMPVFHRDFEAHCGTFAKELESTASDPFLVGIMTDNELQCPVDLLDRFLALDPSNPDTRDGRAAADAWLAARKGAGAGAASIGRRDRYEFIAFAFERYYRIVSAAIRRHDTNHLYLGSRINYSSGQFDNPWFWKALAPTHDVVSVNYYGQWGPQAEQFADWEAWGGRPVLLTEWYAKAMDVPGLANTHGAGWLVRTQEDRGRFYQHFALAALEIPTIVGWHFFKFLDDPPESKALDNAGGANKGMFDVTGAPHVPLLDRARAVNREVYPLIRFFDGRK